MFIPKKNRLAILSYLFKEGVLVSTKEIQAPKHMVLEVPNLHVIKLMQSLKSKGWVTFRYNWGYFFWVLTDAGIEALREQLHVSTETIPATLRKRDKPQPEPSFGQRSRDDDREGGGFRGGRGGFRGGRGGFRGDRDEYRTGAPKKFDDGAPRNFSPDFESRRGRGGFRGGRGRGGGGERGGFGGGGDRGGFGGGDRGGFGERSGGYGERSGGYGERSGGYGERRDFGERSSFRGRGGGGGGGGGGAPAAAAAAPPAAAPAAAPTTTA